jgi:hypothetical protein
MAGFDTFDLGRVIQTAEAIKQQRRSEGDDLLRRQYMQQQISSGQQNQDIQKQQFDQQKLETEARKKYYVAQAALNSADPKAAVQELDPDFVQKFESAHGPGSWTNLPPEKAALAVNNLLTKAVSVIGPQTKVKWIDSGGQHIAVDEATGQPIKGAAPIAKSASPDSLLSAQTSAENARLSASTAIRGQDISAQTTLKGQGVTMRGQDLTAETTKRGQDLTNGPNGKKTEGDKKAAVLFGSMVNAEKQLTGLAGRDTSSLWQNTLGKTDVTKSFQGEDYKKFEAAGLRWAANLLYSKSGATATPDEIRSTWKQYFPQPGDDASVKQQKAEARHQEMQTVAQTYGLDASQIPEMSKQPGTAAGWSIQPVP